MKTKEMSREDVVIVVVAAVGGAIGFAVGNWGIVVALGWASGGA